MIWQEISDIYTKEESTRYLTARHREDEFFCTIWNIKWFKFLHYYILHSKIFPTTHHTPKSEFKRRSYVINKLEKKTSPLVVFVVKKPRFCLNRVSNKLYRDKTRFCRDGVSNKLCRDKPRFCRDKLKTKH